MNDRARLDALTWIPATALTIRSDLPIHATPADARRVGVVRIVLASGAYVLVDAEMTARGYSTTILSMDAEGADRPLQLPPGHYWRDEPTDEIAMRDEAWALLVDLGLELGAQVIATAGLSAWRGLVPVDWPS